MSSAVVASEVFAVGPHSAAPERADIAAWLAVVAGCLGTLMATLDISIVNSSLSTIQGEIGASAAEGTWVATAFLVAEIIIIPLSAWLERLLGLRTFLLLAVTLFIGFSMLCGLSTNLTMMIIGRAGQGITGGALIPTAMTIIATRLPPDQQPVGTALFGVAAILGPVLGPLIGGWLTENISWRYAFFINVPIGALLVPLLYGGLPRRAPHWEELSRADWLGIMGLVLGLGSITVVFEDGQREQWFQSAQIVRLTLLAMAGFGLLFAGQYIASKPVIRLGLVLDRQFGSTMAMAVVGGMVYYGTSYAIPQFLAGIAGDNALQAGKVILLIGVPALLLMPFIPWLMGIVDIRIAVAGGFALMGLSCWLNTSLTAQSVDSDFTLSQLILGAGVLPMMLFLNQAAITSVSAEETSDASALFNAARNLGGSLALAGIATLQDQRSGLHAQRLEESLSANAPAVQAGVAQIGQMLAGPGAAYQFIGATIQREAAVMAYNDLFWLLAVGIMLTLPLVLFLRPLPRGTAISIH